MKSFIVLFLKNMAFNIFILIGVIAALVPVVLGALWINKAYGPLAGMAFILVVVSFMAAGVLSIDDVNLWKR